MLSIDSNINFELIGLPIFPSGTFEDADLTTRGGGGLLSTGILPANWSVKLQTFDQIK